MNVSWPTTAEYEAMLAHPKKAFKEPKFRECVIEKKPNGLPRPRSGNSATVYKAMLPNGENYALRFFSRRSPDNPGRYAVILQYLVQKRLKSIVAFKYMEDGIRVFAGGRPAFFPLVQMEWVFGSTLQEFVRDRCLQHDSNALELMAEHWVELVRELKKAHIAHGDLQHENVLVNYLGELKLVDYDGMFVPQLEGWPTVDGGHVAYQHPARTNDTRLFSGLDHFSALVIYVSLKALAVAPGLWTQFVEPPKNSKRPIRDALLFEPTDFSSPQKSELIQVLRQSSAVQVQRWTNLLLYIWNNYGLEDIPSLDDVLADTDEGLNRFRTASRLGIQKPRLAIEPIVTSPPPPPRKPAVSLGKKVGGAPNYSIFISYRRLDSKHASARIFDSLAAHFGAGAVFRDVNSLEYGKSFEDQLEATLGRCTVLTGIIGPHWIKLLEQKAQYGEDVPDYCLKEILFAIDRGIPAMPVLIDGAKIPEFHELPEKLALETRKKLHRFFRNHAFHLPEDDAAFADGLVRLRQAVQKLVDQSK